MNNRDVCEVCKHELILARGLEGPPHWNHDYLDYIQYDEQRSPLPGNMDCQTPTPKWNKTDLSKLEEE